MRLHVGNSYYVVKRLNRSLIKRWKIRQSKLRHFKRTSSAAMLKYLILFVKCYNFIHSLELARNTWFRGLSVGDHILKIKRIGPLFHNFYCSKRFQLKVLLGLCHLRNERETLFWHYSDLGILNIILPYWWVLGLITFCFGYHSMNMPFLGPDFLIVYAHCSLLRLHKHKSNWWFNQLTWKKMLHV